MVSRPPSNPYAPHRSAEHWREALRLVVDRPSSIPKLFPVYAHGGVSDWYRNGRYAVRDTLNPGRWSAFTLERKTDAFTRSLFDAVDRSIAEVRVHEQAFCAWCRQHGLPTQLHHLRSHGYAGTPMRSLAAGCSATLLTSFGVPTSWHLVSGLCWSELSADEKGRRRYRTTDNRYPFLGRRFGASLTIFRDLLVDPRLFDSLLDRVARGVAGDTYRLVGSVRTIFKAADGVAKVLGDHHPQWRDICFLHQQGGYVCAPPLELFVPDVEEWVNDPLRDTAPGSLLPGWRESFAAGARYMVKGVSPVPPRDTFDAFIRSLRWARSGVSDAGDVPTFFDGNEEIKVRRTKDLVAIGTHPDLLVDIGRRRTPQTPRVIIKREPGKARAVITTDLGLFLKMAWLSESIEGALAGLPYSTLFMRGKQVVNIAYRMGEQSMDHSLIKVPIDQSGFDHSVTFDDIEAILDAMVPLLCTDEQIRVLEDIRYALVVAPCSVDVGTTRVPVHKGVLSGWRWTALIDTWVNFSQVYAALSFLVDSGVAPPVALSGVFFQGDDVRFVTREPGVAIALVEVLRVAGYDINPGKTWVSPLRDEFLRQTAQAGAVTGYLSRAMTSIMWRNPIKPFEFDWFDAVTQCFERWLVAAQRGAAREAVSRHLVTEVRNISGAAGISITRVWRHAVTPVYLGGLGLGWLLPTSLRRNAVRGAAGHFVRRPANTVGSSGRHPGLVGHLAELDNLGLPMTAQQVSEAVIGQAKPYQPYRFKDRAADLISFVANQKPSKWRPVSYELMGYPTAARWRGTKVAPFLFSAAIAAAVENKTYGAIEAMMDPLCQDISPRLRDRHGRGTWSDWVRGGLDLPIDPHSVQNRAFVAGMMSSRVRTLLRQGLAGSSPFRRPQILGAAVYLNTTLVPRVLSRVAVVVGA